jgi:xanthine dehydrogenase YagS FAD-binding subunit
MNRLEWTSAQTLAQALEMQTTTTATSMLSRSGQPPTGAVILKAGGIDLLGLMKDGLLTPARIVNLRAIPELGQIVDQPDGTMRVGANVTLAELAADHAVRTRYRALAAAAGNSASPQLRQVATIGGNLLQRRTISVELLGADESAREQVFRALQRIDRQVELALALVDDRVGRGDRVFRHRELRSA